MGIKRAVRSHKRYEINEVLYEVEPVEKKSVNDQKETKMQKAPHVFFNGVLGWCIRMNRAQSKLAKKLNSAEIDK